MFSLKVKWSGIAAVCCLAIYLLLPSIIDNNWLLFGRKINLGLDLKGGVSLLIEVDLEDSASTAVRSLSDEIMLILKEEKIFHKKLYEKYDDKVLVMEFDDADAAKRVISILEHQKDRYYDVAQVNAIDWDHAIEIKLQEGYIQKLYTKVVRDSMSSIRRRVDESGTKEITLQMQGTRRILLQVPGEEDPTSLKSLLGQTGKMTFNFVDDTVKDTKDVNRLVYKVLTDHNGTEYVVNRKSVLSGDMLTDAHASFNHNGMPAVMFRFNSTGSKKFAQVTRENTGKRFAIILDDKVLTAPMIREPILGGRGEITGNFTMDSANELSLLLRSGVLPAPLKIIEERSVGATLGKDSIQSGKMASIISVIVVAVFMILYYGVFGVYAAIAMVLNILFVFAIMCCLNITLTLPGIAGLILTVGMSVDANVLIFERIREESRDGKTPMKAVNLGFQRAISTILDSNLTTLIGAILMFIIGSGPIKGFAITLSMGILSSMWTAIIITKLMIITWIHFYRPKGIIL